MLTEAVASLRSLRKRVIGLAASARLLPITRAVQREKLTYLSAEKLARIERALRRTRLIKGDIVEFGVALGGSAIVLAKSGGKRFFGLDVFGMIPPPTSEKDDEHSRKRFEEIKAGRSEGIGGDDYYGYRTDLYSDVVMAFQRHGLAVDGERIVLAKGLFEDTWPTLPVGQISLAHIDCDWYDPVRYCLEAIADKMAPGGVVIIDDYHAYGGAKIAVDEFLAARPHFSIEMGENPILVKA
jgi:asparagine synthase (glutamine-hydrolysing)